MSGVYKQNDEFDKLGKDKKSRGRPTGSVSVGKANIKALARKAAQASEEALDLIVEIMRDTNSKTDLRFRAASYIVGATQGLISQVDKQTLFTKQMALLDKKITEADEKELAGNLDKQEGDDDITNTAAVFTLDIVKNDP